MKQIEADLTVGADPDRAVVVLRVEHAPTRVLVDCLLSPAAARIVAGWLKTPRAGEAEKQLSGPDCEVRIRPDEDGRGLRLFVAERGVRMAIESSVAPSLAASVANWLESAADAMAAQAAGEVDLRVIFPHTVERV